MSSSHASKVQRKVEGTEATHQRNSNVDPLGLSTCTPKSVSDLTVSSRPCKSLAPDTRPKTPRLRQSLWGGHPLTRCNAPWGWRRSPATSSQRATCRQNASAG